MSTNHQDASVPAAYFGVILIWATTPLAIQWSGQGVGFLFGVAGRMLLGAVVALMIVALFGSGMRWDRRAVQAYFAGGLGIYGAMTCVYWGAQYIPSGWISVLFGLTPILTGLMARVWLAGERLRPLQWGGLLLGVAGLAVIFGTSLQLNLGAVQGVIGVLVAASIHAASAVWVKRIDARTPAIVQTSGGLLVALPLFLVSWAIGDGSLPQEIPPKTAASILYLGVMGSVVGFTLYYFVLRAVDAVKVALITLITPVCALLLGYLFNREPLTPQVILGTGLILGGLAVFQWPRSRRG